MIDLNRMADIKNEPSIALIAVVDELFLATEGLNGFINLVLDKGNGKTVSFQRQGIANLLDPLLEQFRTAHTILDEARKKIYPPVP